MDTFVGTSGNDTFQAPVGTLNTLDSINGGAGVDTLALSLTAAHTAGPTITGIEKLLINQTTAGGFNAVGIAGLTDITTNGSTVDIGVTSLASAANITVSNQDSAVTVAYADSAVAGTADTVTLTLSNVAQAAGQAIALNNTTTLTGAVGIETLNIVASGAAGTAANTVTINSNATASLTKVNLSGASAANVTMGTNLTTTALTIDASAMTGALTLGGLGAGNHTITGGSGNDTFTFAANFTVSDKVNGGLGADTLSATGAQLASITVANANISSIETLFLSASDANTRAIDLAFFGASSLRVAAQAGASVFTFNNIATGGNIRLDGLTTDGGTAAVFNVKDATLPATADTLNFDLRGTSITHAGTVAGVETFNVNTTNAATASTLGFTATSLTTLNITNAGTSTFDTGTLGANVNLVNASAITGGGAVTITLNGTASTGANVTGSAGADTITDSNLVDVINSGAGNDLIIAGAGADFINVGSGTDVYRAVAGATQTGVIASGASMANADIVTGMGNGDSINLASITNIVVADGAISVGTTFATATANQVVIVSGSYDTATKLFTAGAASTTNNDYVVQYNAGATTTTVNSVVLVDIVGVLTATSATEVVTLTVA